MCEKLQIRKGVLKLLRGIVWSGGKLSLFLRDRKKHTVLSPAYQRSLPFPKRNTECLAAGHP